MDIITDIRQIDRQTWQAFVKGHPHANVFQSPSMYDVYAATPGCQPGVIAVTEDGKLTGVLMYVIMYQPGILRRVSSRAIVQGGPLVADDNNRLIQALLDAYTRETRGKVVYAQFRNDYCMMPYNDAFQHLGYRYEPHLNYVIDLTKDIDTLYHNIGKGRRKQIAKAQRKGLTVRVLTSEQITEAEITAGYNIICDVYRRASLPLADINVIRQAWHQGLLVMFIVGQGDTVMGCRFALAYGSVLYGWYAGSYARYYNMYPNDLLIWETLRWGHDQGYATFDYGGAGNPNKPYGVRAFKAQAGGTLVEYGRYIHICNPLVYYIASVAVKTIAVIKRPVKKQ